MFDKHICIISCGEAFEVCMLSITSPNLLFFLYPMAGCSDFSILCCALPQVADLCARAENGEAITFDVVGSN